jgi:membrane protein implicated in regulation of membrane protease activity
VTTWLGRLGAALVAGVLGGFVLWMLMAAILILARALPIWVMWAFAGIIFAATVVVDWYLDADASRRKRDAYKLARRAAMARDDDEL